MDHFYEFCLDMNCFLHTPAAKLAGCGLGNDRIFNVTSSIAYSDYCYMVCWPFHIDNYSEFQNFPSQHNIPSHIDITPQNQPSFLWHYMPPLPVFLPQLHSDGIHELGRDS